MHKEALEAARDVLMDISPDASATHKSEMVIRAYLDKAVPDDVKEYVERLRRTHEYVSHFKRRSNIEETLLEISVEAADLIEAQSAKIAELKAERDEASEERVKIIIKGALNRERAEKAEAALAEANKALDAVEDDIRELDAFPPSIQSQRNIRLINAFHRAREAQGGE